MNAVRVPGGARVNELARATGTSAMTIRRDLAELEQQGMLRRTHGGAISMPSRGSRLPFAIRADSHPAQKQAIGAAAAGLIEDGMSVIVDAGTTTTAVAEALAGRDITALALSVHVAAALGQRPGVRILTPGGPLNSEELCWEGYSAVRDVERFRADIALLGVCAWDENGLTAASNHDCEMKRAALRSGTRVIAVSTEEKFGLSTTFAVCGSEAISSVVTDAARDEVPEWLDDAGVEVISIA